MKPARGFTLLEMMTVVAIPAVLAALSVNGIRQLTRLGRTNGASAVLARVLVDARVRTMTQRCPHFVQINGPAYVGGGAPLGAPKGKSTINLVRKADCNSANYFFEAGATPPQNDRIISTTIIGDFDAAHYGVYLKLASPTTMLSSTDIESAAFTIGYDVNGTRTLTIDDSGSGTFVPDTATSQTITLRVEGEPATVDGPLVDISPNSVAEVRR